jgi:hypothetical protein
MVTGKLGHPRSMGRYCGEPLSKRDLYSADLGSRDQRSGVFWYTIWDSFGCNFSKIGHVIRVSCLRSRMNCGARDRSWGR